MRICAALFLLVISSLTFAQRAESPSQTYLGFDRNDYPGDNQLAALHNTFAFTGYWLNNPPGETTNSWRGKRQRLRDAGFGFLLLFNGRTYAQIRVGNPSVLGKTDGRSAASTASREGFLRGAIIFLDQEEGGRLLPEQRAYLHAWIDAVVAAGYRAGVYCSGVPFKEGDGTVVVTAEDIRKNAGRRAISFWVSHDGCPPSPGCRAANPPAPSKSGVPFADIWQFAQSPRRKDMTAACADTYSNDGECYAPGIPQKLQLHVDLSSAKSPDPSHGR